MSQYPYNALVARRPTTVPGKSIPSGSNDTNTARQLESSNFDSIRRRVRGIRSLQPVVCVPYQMFEPRDKGEPLYLELPILQIHIIYKPSQPGARLRAKRRS